ncbi:hypothetical protein HNV10_07890 [Winogradskyella litoriviva]|uniref:Uncharacterized protein n=2 Tax=Winogradskyella litoriviva TaxID=1220182 RepID=A0ABX2E404_9FLAO|nr:hypothetical protein [Winogradskyella litoriviva]
MFKNKSLFSYILYAIGEIALIVIGILLALYLQNKNEEKKIKANVITAINMLKDEISTNKSIIDNIKNYHIMVKDTLQNMEIPKSEKEIEGKLGFWRGMRTPRLQNAAFQTSIQSGIGKEFNPKLLKALNGLYTYQDSYNQFTSQSTQIFFGADFSDIRSFGKIMTSIQMTMSDLYWYEKELTETYEFSLKQIDSIYPSKE